MNESLKELKLSRQEEIFAARIKDMFVLCDRDNYCKFSGFLDLRQQKIASYVGLSISGADFSLYGGLENAERKVFGVFPDYIVDRDCEFPLTYIEISHSRPLNHRDFLGSFMSLGIKREMIGDIIVGNNKSFAVISSNMLSHITDNISKIGNVGVSIKECSKDEIPSAQNRFEEATVIVSSLRLDCIISGIFGKSRADSAKLVESERVNVNHELILECSKQVKTGDIISLRSAGKVIIGECNTKTKKGRLILCYKKYI